MDHVMVKIKGPRKNPFFKLVSNHTLYETIVVNVASCVAYKPDHNLDEDSWFKIEQFSQQPYCISFLTNNFDSKDYANLSKEQFPKISYILAIQGNDFYFQKVTPSLYLQRKTFVFGEVAKIEESSTRLVVNAQPDAVYIKSKDTLVFRNLAAISSIFKGIDELYKEATSEEVSQFLDESFVELANGYDVEKVSKPNRRRIALAMTTLSAMSDEDKSSMLNYVNEYCQQKLNFDQQNQKFEIATDDDLKLLVYGIEQRFYTTPFGQERRIANSIIKMS